LLLLQEGGGGGSTALTAADRLLELLVLRQARLVRHTALAAHRLLLLLLLRWLLELYTAQIADRWWRLCLLLWREL
jgi:hypothetical protein